MFWCCCTESQTCFVSMSFSETVDGWTVLDGGVVEGGVGTNGIWLPSASAIVHIAFQWVDSSNYNYVSISTGNHEYDWMLRIYQVRAGVETLVTSENFSVANAFFPVTVSRPQWFCLQWELGTLRVQLEQTFPANSPPASGARGHVIRTYAIPWLPSTKTATKALNGAHLGGIADPPTTAFGASDRPPSDMGGCMTCNHIVDTPFGGCCRQNLMDDWQIDLSGWSTVANGRFTGCADVANVYILQVYQPYSADAVYDSSPEFSEDGWVYAQKGPTACDPITNQFGVLNPRLYLRIDIVFGRDIHFNFPGASSGCGWLVSVNLHIVSNNEACNEGEIVAVYFKQVSDPTSCSGVHTLTLVYQHIHGICGIPPATITIQSASVV